MKYDTNLDFDGLAGTGVNRAKNPYAGNQSGLKSRENYGMGPRTGNASDSSHLGGKSVTRDPHRKTIATASQGGRINGGATARCPANPDKINVGMK